MIYDWGLLIYESLSFSINRWSGAGVMMVREVSGVSVQVSGLAIPDT
jgi:hypothetical protein